MTASVPAGTGMRMKSAHQGLNAGTSLFYCGEWDEDKGDFSSEYLKSHSLAGVSL